jgi:hypothetical protein
MSLEKQNDNINESFLSNISELTEEVKEKKNELEVFKNQIKLLKQEYQKQLSVYFSMNKNVIQIENNIENILKEKTKLYKKNTLIILDFNVEKIKRINDISNRPNDKNVEDLILEFFDYDNSSFEELIVYNKNENEWKLFLNYALNKKYSPETIKKLKLILDKINKDINYPYHLIIDFIKGIIRLNEIEKELISLNEKLINENKSKNEIFLQLKAIETDIIKNDYLYKKMIKYIKSIYSILETYSKIKSRNDKISSEEYRVLNKNIKDFQKIDFKNLIIPTDNLSSLSVRTNISDTESLHSLSTLNNLEEQKDFSSSLINSDNVNNNNTKNNKINKIKNVENFPLKNGNTNNNSLHQMIIKNTNTNTKIITNKSICKPQKKIKNEDSDDDNYSDNENDLIEKNGSIKMENLNFVNIHNDINLTLENIEGGITFVSPMNFFTSLPSKLYEDQKIFQKKIEENKFGILRNGREKDMILQREDDGSGYCSSIGCCNFGSIFG